MMMRRRRDRYQSSAGKTEITTEYYLPLSLLNQIFRESLNTVDVRTTARDVREGGEKRRNASDAAAATPRLTGRWEPRRLASTRKPPPPQSAAAIQSTWRMRRNRSDGAWNALM